MSSITKDIHKKKFIKDNLHDYIYIEKPFFKIIDTSIFQRLKNIKQTSYVSLYPSSTHDRFMHSIGTFFLGCIAIESLIKNVEEQINKDLKKIKFIGYSTTFKLACLLHDVGHSPFSHTGEGFFHHSKYSETDSSGKTRNIEFFEKLRIRHKIGFFCEIDIRLIEAVAKHYSVDLNSLKFDYQNPNFYGLDEDFSDFVFDFCDVLARRIPKPHEIMSAALSLESLKDEILKVCDAYGCHFDASLFVRCIVGATYTKKRRHEEQTKNAIISLLNSDIIDVDKLDYISRDKYMTGYRNVDVDIERLVKSFTIVKKHEEYRLGYKKSAFSVIENVILANDSLKRWVQNHPIILYDVFITQKSIVEAIKILDKYKNNDRINIFEKFFSIDALTEKGIKIYDNEEIFLVSDIEVITLIKKAYLLCIKNGEKETEDILHQFFSRTARRHSLWKSEMEYKVCFNEKNIIANDNHKARYNHIIKCINGIIPPKDDALVNVVINNKFVEEYEQNKNYQPEVMIFLKAIEKYFENNAITDIDLVILNCDIFESNLKKLNINNLYIEMPNYSVACWMHDNIYSYSELVDVHNGEKVNNKMFYFYSKHPIDTKNFVEYLMETQELRHANS